ncbi:agmatine deiminase family protein [Haloechinothrix sp. LS1_15]|nr:agmatine deiminase family protein [Haloechinothrix sp. LS1_15]
MPAEWAVHERTWMAFPCPNETFGAEGTASLAAAREAWARVAATLVRYEPVTLLAGTGQVRQARDLVPGEVDVVEVPLDDAWLRDSGPTFVTDLSSPTGLAAVDWIFNGWGAQPWASWTYDALLGGRLAELAGHRVRPSLLVTEGGGFCTDGEGTVLLTDTVQLDPRRNPGWTRTEVEAELHSKLGTSTAVWLPRGLTRDYDRFGTRGHVDLLACFLAPGLVAVHTQHDPEHPDHEVSAEAAALLRVATDAAGRNLDVVELPAPRAGYEPDGRPTDYSYINHYVANGVVLLPTFDDPHDERAAEVLRRAYPDRVIEPIPGNTSRTLFAFGGGVHCITQQQPARSEPATQPGTQQGEQSCD